MEPNTSFGWPYTHVTADVQVKAGKGVLHSVVLNGLTTAGDLTIFDSLTEAGTVIAILHLDPTTSISVQPITFPYDLKFDTGLYFGYDATLVADLTVMHN
ncbi:hypothetical protein LCGC14_2832750 [marine sediment metagenome]|uniref:Uncharacterized protein n=1 Tax=marine sediment metagenome TaxID=412755 RepID=A0A0F8Z0C7_9ZZZZ